MCALSIDFLAFDLVDATRLCVWNQTQCFNVTAQITSLKNIITDFGLADDTHCRFDFYRTAWNNDRRRGDATLVNGRVQHILSVMCRTVMCIFVLSNPTILLALCHEQRTLWEAPPTSTGLAL